MALDLVTSQHTRILSRFSHLALAMALIGVAALGGSACQDASAKASNVSKAVPGPSGSQDDVSPPTTAPAAKSATRSSTKPKLPGPTHATASTVPAGATAPGKDAFRLPVTASVASACVRPGGMQSVDIKTEPEARVAYGSTYSDGSSALSSTFYGGNNGGVVDRNGAYHDTWVIDLKAPPGPVKVEVAAVHAKDGIGQVDLWFAVAGPSGACA